MKRAQFEMEAKKQQAQADKTYEIQTNIMQHQAIAEAFGGQVIRAPQLMHGKTSRITHGGTGLFEGLPSPLEVMRYHSLTVDNSTLPDCIEVLAWGEHGREEIHAMKHREHKVWGVQFHPESVMTQNGKDIIRNFLRLAS